MHVLHGSSRQTCPESAIAGQSWSLTWSNPPPSLALADEKKGTSNGQPGKLLAWPAVIAIPSHPSSPDRHGPGDSHSWGHVLQQEGQGTYFRSGGQRNASLLRHTCVVAQNCTDEPLGRRLRMHLALFRYSLNPKTHHPTALPSSIVH